jgi:hypothetical protein
MWAALAGLRWGVVYLAAVVLILTASTSYMDTAP